MAEEAGTSLLFDLIKKIQSADDANGVSQKCLMRVRSLLARNLANLESR